ncbi:MAG: CPBP family intramembrane metalloprotease [Acidobacteriia bacterium]|nr:CPBP family intramembrane metalloprotease [Terriglobia bacterium]
MQPDRLRHSPAVIAWTYLYVVFLYVAWVLAWLLERALERRSGWITTSGGQFGYWFVMKLLLWIFPALILIRLSGRPLGEVVGLRRLQSALLWGTGVGLCLGAVVWIQRSVTHQPLFHPVLNWPFLSGVCVAPIIEEITFRGAILGNLMRRHRFAIANSVTAFLFLGSHLPGWYFQGRLLHMLTRPVGGGLGILFLGWVFGFVAHKSKSVAGSTWTHFLNNFFNA